MNVFTARMQQKHNLILCLLFKVSIANYHRERERERELNYSGHDDSILPNKMFTHIGPLNQSSYISL